MRAMALRAHQKNLELLYDIDAGVPVNVMGDPGRLRQILINLVGNALKFTEKGEVTVLVSRNECSEQGVELQFKVTDTGIGIPAGKQPLIFDAFMQADGSTTRTFGGTGLGLAISSKLVGMMKGHIWVESIEKKGSSFYFTARFGKPHEAATPIAITSSKAELLNLPVLIVDDNATNRAILSQMTSSWGMKPTAVDSGNTALAILQQSIPQVPSPELIIIDSQMPGMSGFELTKEIRKQGRVTNALIMMLTSTGQIGDGARCRDLGIAAYLVKPICKSELLAAILAILGEQKSSGPKTLVTRHRLRAADRGLHVLLVEDNLVNQIVARKALEKMGHHVDVVSNGAEAVDKVFREAFDLVLMDVQMPVMDGLAATRKIRHKEKETGAHVPIMAMTARAMRGDREMCLNAGMDGYVSKPLNRQELETCMSQFDRASEPNLLAGLSNPPAKPIVTPHRPVEWDRSAALEKLGNDEQLLFEAAEIFLEEGPKLLLTLKQGLADQDAQTVERSAHSLKGALSCLGASCATKARALEELGHKRDLTPAAVIFEGFEVEFQDLVQEVQRVIHHEVANR